MRSRFVLGVVLAATVAFGGGVALGAAGTFGLRVPTSVGDGIVGEKVATIWANGTAYGARDSVPWRDAVGANHLEGWPACLADGPVTAVRFAGATVWTGDVGASTILWVDCQGRP